MLEWKSIAEMRPGAEIESLATETTAGVGFATISSESSFADLGGTWDDLVRAMPRPSPFLLHTWILEWLRHYGGAAELAVHVAFRDGKLAAALPLVLQSWGGLRVAKFVGGKQCSLADVLLAQGEDDSLGASVVERASSEHAFAELFGLAAESRLVRMAGPGRLRLFQRSAAPVLDLGDDWDALYQAKLSAKHRSDYRRRLRQLHELGKVEFSVARTREEFEPALEEAFRLHAVRWEGRPDASGFVAPTGIKFHRAVFGALADENIARLVTMSLNGRAIAFVLYFALADVVYPYRLAFEPSFGRFSPGVLTLLETIAHAARDNSKRVELLGGAEPYKVMLADRFEPLHLGVGLANGAAGHAAVNARVAMLSLRERLSHSERARRLYEAAAPALRRVRGRKDALSS